MSVLPFSWGALVAFLAEVIGFLMFLVFCAGFAWIMDRKDQT